MDSKSLGNKPAHRLFQSNNEINLKISLRRDYKPSSVSLWCAGDEDAETTSMHPVCWLGQ